MSDEAADQVFLFFVHFGLLGIPKKVVELLAGSGYTHNDPDDAYFIPPSFREKKCDHLPQVDFDIRRLLLITACDQHILHLSYPY